MNYTPTIWENGKKPAINATHLNKMENELARLANIVSVPDITEITSPTMPNSYDGRLLVEEIGGVCEQNTTAGNQLFDKNNANYVEYLGVNATTMTFTNSSEATRTYYVSATPNTTYTFSKEVGSFNRVVTCENIPVFGGTITNKNDDTSKNTATITTGANDKYIAFYPLLVSEFSTISYEKMLEKVMLNLGTTTLPWEPYTGGIPSPNPSYPQEIKKTVVSEIKTHGKNFINQVCIIATDKKCEKHYLKAGTYTASKDESEPSGAWYLGAYDESGNVITESAMTSLGYGYSLNSNKEYWYGGTNSKDSAFTISADCYVKIGVLNGSGNTYLMLNEGDTALPYEPYTESVITLSNPIDLYGKGDVQDVITPKQAKRRFAIIVFDGSDDEAWRAIDLSKGAFSISLGDYLNVYNQSQKCTHYEYSTQYKDKTFKVENGYCYLRNTDYSTLDELKNALIDSPITVVFQADEEVTEDLPLADQIALNSLETYDGITYLEFDAEIQPTFKGEYGTSKVGGYTLEALLTARSK